MPDKETAVGKKYVLLMMTLMVVTLSTAIMLQNGNAQTVAKKAALKGVRVQSGVVRKVKPVPSAAKDRKVTPVIDSSTFVYNVVDVQAKFEGGDPEWRKFLERNLNRDIAVENGAPAGNYSVVVSFVVDRNSCVSDVRAENNPGFGVAEEAVRLIKMSGRWTPAIKNGRYVAYRQRQSLHLCLAEE